MKFACPILFLCRSEGAEPARIDFARDVQPTLNRSCRKCHGADMQNGGLRFDRWKSAFGVGDSGKRAITPCKIGDSELLRRVELSQLKERMPPKSDPLRGEAIKVLRDWITQEANWPTAEAIASENRSERIETAEDWQHWSYRPLHEVEQPTVQEPAWCQTPIDLCVLGGLDSSLLAKILA